MDGRAFIEFLRKFHGHVFSVVQNKSISQTWGKSKEKVKVNFLRGPALEMLVYCLPSPVSDVAVALSLIEKNIASRKTNVDLLKECPSKTVLNDSKFRPMPSQHNDHDAGDTRADTDAA